MNVYGVPIYKLDGRRADFVTHAGLLVEVKTDTHKATGNLFMERFSSIAKRTPGGPWQSLSKGVDVFVYQMPNTQEDLWVFDTKKLVYRLDALIEAGVLDTHDGVIVDNHRWKTFGYKVPMQLLEDLSSKKILWEGLV